MSGQAEVKDPETPTPPAAMPKPAPKAPARKAKSAKRKSTGAKKVKPGSETKHEGGLAPTPPLKPIARTQGHPDNAE